MAHDKSLSFLLDVDNTLLDNDALKDYMSAHLRAVVGAAGLELFWSVYETVRQERDVVDMPLTIERFVTHLQSAEQATAVRQVIDTLPFRDFVYPHAFDTIAHLKTLGTVGILSDGDQVFQRRKIVDSGLGGAVNGCILIYAHKEAHLDEVASAQPADHSVLVDDKARILHEVKELLGGTVTTVFVRQGHYAREALPEGFTPDLTAATIGDLRTHTADDFWPERGAQSA